MKKFFMYAQWRIMVCIVVCAAQSLLGMNTAKDYEQRDIQKYAFRPFPLVCDWVDGQSKLITQYNEHLIISQGSAYDKVLITKNNSHLLHTCSHVYDAPYFVVKLYAKASNKDLTYIINTDTKKRTQRLCTAPLSSFCFDPQGTFIYTTADGATQIGDGAHGVVFNHCQYLVSPCADVVVGQHTAEKSLLLDNFKLYFASIKKSYEHNVNGKICAMQAKNNAAYVLYRNWVGTGRRARPCDHLLKVSIPHVPRHILAVLLNTHGNGVFSSVPQDIKTKILQNMTHTALRFKNYENVDLNERFTVTDTGFVQIKNAHTTFAEIELLDKKGKRTKSISPKNDKIWIPKNGDGYIGWNQSDLTAQLYSFAHANQVQ